MTRSRLGNAALNSATGTAVQVAGIRHAHAEGAHLAALRSGLAESLRAVPVALLARSPWQPRTQVDADADAFAALVESIRAHGVLEPLLARELPGGALELLAGERRLEASKAAGLETVPVRVLRELTDAEARAVAVTENLARKDLTPWETAHAVAALRAARREAGAPVDVRTLAAVAGLSKTVTAEALRIAEELTPEVLAEARALAGGTLVRSPDKLPHRDLYGVAAAPTASERVRALALLTRSPAPAALAARGGAGSVVRTPDTAPGEVSDTPPEAVVAPTRPGSWRLVGSPEKRLAFRLVRPVAVMPPAEAAAALEALAPLVRALKRQAKGEA